MSAECNHATLKNDCSKSFSLKFFEGNILLRIERRGFR